MKKSVYFFLILLLFVALVAGCSKQPVTHHIDMPIDSVEPVEIRDWVEKSKNLFLAQSKELNGKQYLLVTYGMKPTGGYNVEITDISHSETQLTVTVEFTKPNSDQPVTQALTFPFDLAVIDATGLPVEFVAAGDEFHVPSLKGIDELKPIVAHSEGIKLFAPSSGSVVRRSFTVEGVANVFEGNVLYKASDQKGTVLVSGFTTATMGDWGYFQIPIVLDDFIEVNKLTLELYTQSAKDGSVQDLIEINLYIE